jgi:hypothetical protein
VRVTAGFREVTSGGWIKGTIAATIIGTRIAQYCCFFDGFEEGYPG